MVKKKKDTLEDIMDRIQEEIDLLRDKVYDLENQSDDDEGPEDWSDEDSEDEDSDEE